MTISLVNGFVTAILADTAYAVPLGSYRILSESALTYSSTVDGVYATLSNAELEPGALLTAGGFIKCTINTNVVLKKTGWKKTYAGMVGRSTPLSFWRFNEQSGSTLYDSAAANHLTKGSGVTLAVAGPLGDSSFAITLDGTSNGVANLTNTVDTWFGETAISFEAWVYNPAWSASHEVIISLGSAGHYLSVQNAKLHMSIRVPASQYTNLCLTQMTALAWHHVAGTWESGDQLRLYVDGVEVTGNTTTVRSGVLETSPNIYVGSFAGGSLFFSGTVADVAIYLRKLTAAEISAHYGARLVK